MKIDRNGDKLVIYLPSEGESRIDFFHGTFGVFYQEWIDGNTPVFDTEVFSLSATAASCKLIQSVAKRLGFEITDGANALLEKIAEKHEEWMHAERIKEAERMARERAILRLKNGCGFCLSLSWNGKAYICKKNEKPCATSAEEIERLFEEWKETKMYVRPTPFPNSECTEIEVLR